MAGEKDILGTWQAGVGLLAAVLGLFVVTRKKAPAEPAPSAVGPAGFGEVGGYGAIGGSSPASSSSTPAPTRGGEQTPTAANESPRGLGVGHLVPKVEPRPEPGESQAEYEKRRGETALPGARRQAVTA